MAARAGDGGGLSLSPRAMRIAGWLAVIGLIAVVALAVRLLGGNADGAAVVPSPSASPGGPHAIVFGTQLDPATGQVPEAAATGRFVPGDLFAYSVPPDDERPEAVFVEVTRADGTGEEVVQAAADARQVVPPDRPAVGFTVPVDRLFEVFGAGAYRMRIYLDPDEPPIAEGSFELVSAPSESAAPPSG
jgi:hypothetical protein